MADETVPNQPSAGSEPSAMTAEAGPAAPSAATDSDASSLTSASGHAADDDDDEDEEDEEAVDEVIGMEDETAPVVQTSDDAGTVTLRLSTELRRRLRRRADREGVAPEELAEELLGAAIRRPAAESLPDVLARVEKLERTVAELGTARARPETPAASPRRPEERPRGDFGSRTPGGFGERNNDRGPSERPSYGDRDRGGYAGPHRQEDRPRFSDRPSSGGFGRPEGRFGDRPRYDAPDRGPARPSFDRRNDRDDRNESRDRPARRWESPRRGE